MAGIVFLPTILSAIAASAVVSFGVATVMARRELARHAKAVGDAYDAGCNDARRQCGCPECRVMVRLYEEHGSSPAVVEAMRGHR